MQGFISKYFTQIEQMIDQVTFQGYSNLSHDIAPVLYMGIGIYIALTGLLMIKGTIEISQKAYTNMIWTIVVALTIALNWDFVSTYIYKMFNHVSLGVAQSVFDSVDKFHSSSSLYDFIQQVWDRQTAVGDHFHAQVTWKNWGPAFYGWIVYIVSLILIVVTLLEITILKLAFALMIIFMPFFALMSLFPKFNETLDSYFGVLIGTLVALIFVLGAIAISFSLINWSLELSYGQGTSIPDQITNSSIWPFVVVSGVSIGFIFYSMKLGYSTAGTSGGGQTGTAMMAGAMGFAAAKMNSPAKAIGGVARSRGGEIFGNIKERFKREK